MRYINTKTRKVIESDSVIIGANWQPYEAAKKKEPAPPVKEESPVEEPAKAEEAKEEKKEAPKAEKKPAKTSTKNTVKPRKRS